MRRIRAAFVGFAEVNCPRELVQSMTAKARTLLEQHDIDLIPVDLVTDDPEELDVARARKQLANQDFDLLVLCIAGWIPSHAVVNVIEQHRHKPMLLWGLSGHQEGDRFVTTAAQAGTTALRKSMEDLGYRFKYIVNYRDAGVPIEKIVQYASAARAATLLRDARIGMMGFRDMRLYATLHDGVSLKRQIGPDVEVFEMLEMAQAIEALDPADVAAAVDDVRSRWTFVRPPAEGTVERTAALYLALRQKVDERGYDALSLIDVDGVKKLMRFAPAGVFMMLHEHRDISTIPENDVMGMVTQLMMRYLTGQVSAYMEFYECFTDRVLMGVPDYVPPQIVDGPVLVMPTAFGQFGEGLLNVSKVKPGRVTLARLTYKGDDYAIHMVTGTAREASPWEEAGWTPPAPQLPSLEITLDEPMEQFTQKVLAQHYILTYGDNTGALRDLCQLLGVSHL